LLNLIGLLSFVFVAWFTHRAYRQPSGTGQSPREAIIEAWMNLAIGFTINYVANLVILPAIFHSHLSHWDNFVMGWVYTAISIVRQYAIRRWFNSGRQHAFVHWIAARLP
jgi:hypothetical protein